MRFAPQTTLPSQSAVLRGSLLREQEEDFLTTVPKSGTPVVATRVKQTRRGSHAVHGHLHV